MKLVENPHELWPACNSAFDNRITVPVAVVDGHRHPITELHHAQNVSRYLSGNMAELPRRADGRNTVFVRDARLYEPLLRISAKLVGLSKSEETEELIADRLAHELAHGRAVRGREHVVVSYGVRYMQTKRGVPYFAPSANLGGQPTPKDVADFMRGPKRLSGVDKVALSF